MEQDAVDIILSRDAKHFGAVRYWRGTGELNFDRVERDEEVGVRELFGSMSLDYTGGFSGARESRPIEPGHTLWLGSAKKWLEGEGWTVELHERPDLHATE